MAVAKGIGSGFPMGACLATSEASIGMIKGIHGSTFGGNPLAVSVGKAVLVEIISNNFLENVDIVARYLWAELKKLESIFDELVEVRGAGLLLGLKTKTVNIKFNELLIKEGLLTIVASDNIVRLSPPLIISKNNVNEAINIIRKVLEDLDG